MRSSTETYFDDLRREMVGTKEIADHADVGVGTVRKWRVRGIGFPVPVAVLAMGPVWLLQDVDAWLRETGRQ